MASPLVGIIMGSTSDWETMRHTAETLDALGVAYETRVVSAHRTPQRLYDYATTAADRGLLMSDGAANPEAFLSFVRRAVRGRWVETGRMTKMDRRAE